MTTIDIDQKIERLLSRVTAREWMLLRLEFEAGDREGRIRWTVCRRLACGSVALARIIEEALLQKLREAGSDE